jgi:hypothetical protein
MNNSSPIDRGVMLDISRDKVYTMETMKTLVDLLSSLKFNELQLCIKKYSFNVASLGQYLTIIRYGTHISISIT